MRLPRHAAQRVQTMCPETIAKSLHLLPLIAFCTAAKAALLQAQAQSLHLCYALCPKPKKLLACDPAFLQVQGLHATRLHTKRIIARLKRACMAGRGSHAWRPSSKVEPSNFCAKQDKKRRKGVDAGEAGWSCRQPLRDTRRGRLAGGREAGGELGEDAHGELWMRGHGDG